MKLKQSSYRLSPQEMVAATKKSKETGIPISKVVRLSVRLWANGKLNYADMVKLDKQ